MNYSRLIFIFFMATNLSWSQEHPEFYNRPFVVFQGCDDAKDKERCYEINLHELIGKQLNHKSFKDSIFYNAKKDTISLSTNLLYDEKGIVDKGYSNISISVKGFFNDRTKPLLDSIPKVKPVLDDYNNGVSSNIRKIFGFFLDKTKDSIIPILGYIPNEIPFSIIERVPVYRGCDKDLNNKDLKQCMNEKVTKLVSNNFNPKLANKLGLSPGVKRIFVVFKIDKKGRVTDIRARGPHPALEEEAIRVIQKIPKLKKPGYQKGKAVIVPYSLPIVFRVTN